MPMDLIENFMLSGNSFCYDSVSWEYSAADLFCYNAMWFGSIVLTTRVAITPCAFVIGCSGITSWRSSCKTVEQYLLREPCVCLLNAHWLLLNLSHS